jgi:hypothetical protein
LEDFTRDEVLARGSFEREVVHDCLNFVLFESVKWGFKLVRGFQNTDEGFFLAK